MHPTLVTPATDTPVSLAEAKAHLRIDAGVTEFDDQIEAFIKAATVNLEKSLGLALVTQTWRETFDGFWCPIRLSMRPVDGGSVTISYFDAANATQMLPGASYAVFGDMVSFAAGVSLPSTYRRPDAVKVEYNAGVIVADVPSDLKAAILLHVGFLFEARESHAEKPWQASGAYEALTFPYRLIHV